MYDMDGTLERLLKARIIDISGSITYSTAAYVREAVLRLRVEGSPEVEVNIASAGGNADAGLQIYVDIRLYSGKTTGVVIGKALSTAAIILQACTHRTASKHSSILVHNATCDVSQFRADYILDMDKFANARKDVVAAQRRIFAIYQQRTGRSIREIKALSARDLPLSADKAKQFGLIDKIV